MRLLSLNFVALMFFHVASASQTFEKPAMTIVGIECRTSNSPEDAPVDIPNHWGKFCSEKVMDQIQNKVSSDVIALYCDYEGDHTKPYSLVIGCAVDSLDSVPEGMVSKVIPSGNYAHFPSIGEHPHAVIEAWGEIWHQSDLKRTYTGDYEVYGDKFYHSPSEVDIWIAVEKE